MYSLAAIDLGSNAARLAIGHLDKDFSLIEVENFREAVRLGPDVFSNGMLSEISLARALEAFKFFRRIIDDHQASNVRAVATSAMREAKNAQVLIGQIAAETGIKLEVISGEEEARLIFSAVASKVELQDKTAILIDIGGGSVEITLSIDGQIAYTNTYPMGVVRLLSILQEKRRSRQNFPKLVAKFSNVLKKELDKLVAGRQIDLLIGTGGNIECLGELRQKVLGKKRSALIRLPELKTIRTKIEMLSYEQRIKELDLKPDRADVIFPGCLLLEQVFEQLDLPEMIIPNVGLKDGVLIEQSQSLQGLSISLVKRRQAVLASARELSRKYRIDQNHTKNVARLALELFDQTQDLHGFSGELRLLLEAAALVHDVGRFINANSHHKHSQYILRAEPFVGLTQREKELVTNIVRFHRRAVPELKHSEYAALSVAERQIVSGLAALLRVANALDHEHASNVQSVKLRHKDGVLEMELVGENGMLLERWALEDAVRMFEEVFKTKVDVIEN